MIILYMPTDEKNLSVQAKKLLCFGLLKYFGIKHPSFGILKGGKPYLTDTDNIDFNISHTKGMILCAITDNGKIGVDVEHTRKIHNNVSFKVYHSLEINYVNEDEEKSQDRFFEIWTKKEAYTKYLGTGLRNNITDINMLSDIHKSKINYWVDKPYYFSVYSDDVFSKPVKIEFSEIENI